MKIKTYLKHKDGTEQEVYVIYGPFTEDGGGIVHKEPSAVIQIIGVDLKKKWSVKTIPIRFLRPEYAIS